MGKKTKTSNTGTSSNVPNLGHYLSRAGRIADKPCRNRFGFGAFRHYNEILKDTARLAIGSSLLNIDSPVAGKGSNVRENILDILNGVNQPELLFNSTFGTPSAYTPPGLWALYWALAWSEHEFLSEWIPAWSHEERLTGCLLAEIRSGFREFRNEWADLSRLRKKRFLDLSLSSYDVATGNRESKSGADFGLILHVKLPGNKEFFRSFLFQAKKVPQSGSARIDIAQAQTLTKYKELGYYIFYHQDGKDKWNPVPTIQEAERVVQKIKQTAQEDSAEVKKPARSRASKPPVKPSSKKNSEESPRTRSLFVRDAGYEFASFITFAGADYLSNFGVLSESPEKALSALTSWELEQDELCPPVIAPMTIAMGKKAQKVDWPRLLARKFDK